MVIEQGDVAWAELPVPIGSSPGYARPVVVVSSDVHNRSRLATVIVAVITSNLALERMKGNVRLAEGEANLSKPSVVNITQLLTIDRSQIKEKLGTLRGIRIRQVLEGVGYAVERADE